MVRNFFEFEYKNAQMPRPKTEGRNMFAAFLIYIFFFCIFCQREKIILHLHFFLLIFYFVFCCDHRKQLSLSNSTVIIFFQFFSLLVFFLPRRTYRKKTFLLESRKEIELNHIIVVNFHKLYGNFPSPASSFDE